MFPDNYTRIVFEFSVVIHGHIYDFVGLLCPYPVPQTRLSGSPHPRTEWVGVQHFETPLIGRVFHSSQCAI